MNLRPFALACALSAAPLLGGQDSVSEPDLKPLLRLPDRSELQLLLTPQRQAASRRCAVRLLEAPLARTPRMPNLRTNKEEARQVVPMPEVALPAPPCQPESAGKEKDLLR